MLALVSSSLGPGTAEQLLRANRSRGHSEYLTYMGWTGAD
jgi:hypothetical protein